MSLALNLPVHSCSVQLSTFAKDDCKGDNGREGIYEHEMGTKALGSHFQLIHFLAL